MPEIDGGVLMMAIQAVDEKMHRLVAEIEQDKTPAGADLEELLLSYYKTAEALKAGYEKARSEDGDLFPYEELVRGWPKKD